MPDYEDDGYELSKMSQAEVNKMISEIERKKGGFMSDDDKNVAVYVSGGCGCERCVKNNIKKAKVKQINALLDFIDSHIAEVKEKDFEVYAAIRNLTKVLQLMNGIE